MHKVGLSIPVAGPWISEKEIKYVTDAVMNGWYDHANDYILRFEDSFKNYLGRKYAISLPSCTSGLHLSLLALGVGPGDEIIIPDSTWIASAAPIIYVGATPIFADIDPNTWCISEDTVKPLISKKTKGIIAVNLYGHMPDYTSLLNLGLPIIEDAAESIGSKYKSKLSGTFGVFSCFSFHGSKTLTTGEGGMLLTDDTHLYERCMIMRDHGRLPGDTLFQNVEVGYKYKMSALQAALGLAQLERIDELVEKKRSLYKNYEAALEGVDSVRLNPQHPDVFNSYWMSSVTFSPEIKMSKFEIIAALAQSKISTRPFFQPLSSLGAFNHSVDKNRAKEQNKIAYDISSRTINLPSAANVGIEHVEFIKKEILKIR